jgi:2'-hydroxyisoflavone reductase
MHIGIIGGTIFVGRHLVDAALERKHTVTIFHRGKHNPDSFPKDKYPEVETLLGDRENEAEIHTFAERGFDAVVDTCGYFPRQVRLSAEKLVGKTPFYCFISSVSAYADLSQPGVTEDSPLATTDTPDADQITAETYGPLKVLCEQEVQQAFPEGALILRPGYIVGPLDPTDRFTYWVHRIAHGGEVLCPGDPETNMQVIDCRDLAEWTVRLLERKVAGVFNVVGPDYPLTFGEFFETCQSVSSSNAILTWVSEEFLEQHEVKAGLELPLWIPQSSGYIGIDRVDYRKAASHGLTIRPLSETVRDTLEWDMSRPQENAWRNTLKPEREQELLAAWHLAKR